MKIDRQSELRDSVDDVGLSDEYAASIMWMRNRMKQHDAMIDAGRKWEREAPKAIEDRLVSENENVRVFSTDGPFCNHAYYSPSQEKIIPAIISYNERFGSITLSFADGGKDFSAKEIVQSLWGPEAGGRDGIAGSPRGKKMTREDLEEIYTKVSDIYREKEKDTFVLPKTLGEDIQRNSGIGKRSTNKDMSRNVTKTKNADDRER